jgi:hypothetical protein
VCRKNIWIGRFCRTGSSCLLQFPTRPLEALACMCSVRDRPRLLFETRMLLPLAVCSLNRLYLIRVTVCSLCKRTWSLLAESVLVPAVIPDLADNWICCTAARRVFEIRAAAALFVFVPGNYSRPGHFLESPCYHRDFERLTLFTASLILICIEIWPRLALLFAIIQPALVLVLWDHRTLFPLTLHLPCASLQVEYC